MGRIVGLGKREKKLVLRISVYFSVTDPIEMVKLTAEMKKGALKELSEIFAKKSGMGKEEWEEEGKNVLEQEQLFSTGAGKYSSGICHFWLILTIIS